MDGASPAGERRRLIFENVVTGVPIADIMAAFSLSALEVEQDVAFVSRKLKEYRFRRAMPPLACETPFDRSLNRRALLDTLRRLGNVYLSSPFLIPKVGIHSVDSVAQAKQAARQVGARVTTS